MQETLNQDLGLLGVALAIGLLVGVERGWQLRHSEDGQRVAGLRTYALISLLGAVTTLIAKDVGAWMLGAAFLGLAGVLVMAYQHNPHHTKDISVTSLISALLTFALGSLAALGYVMEASATAVVATLVLALKTVLHRWLWLIERQELWAALELLLISVVILPILPDRGMGPWQALNPYEIWWMVVLISSISFVGYFAMKFAGAQRGLMATALFAGLVSSTALTLQFARLAREDERLHPILAGGILFACGTMFPRVLLVASVINPELSASLAMPMLLMGAFVYLPAIFYWWTGSQTLITDVKRPANPLSLTSALMFGALLAGILLLSQGLQLWLGEAGILLVAAASGVADVDPINLSLSRMSRDGGLGLDIAVLGIVIAASVNSLLKASMAGVLGGKGLVQRVSIPLFLAVVSGLLAAWWLSF
ncbi:Uncharacterized membrane protein, DUF4010 family [Allopseudospirillum japonicum]|uniref:Uncharacterized membrane protein, DUF4010 family n=1 Tax=Allopseudospirillum japonicum TaxID=64971 RepID=A0A1H6RPV1_9GAMM|nr:MgtC/SapB family protein [Allopseudospirillum japonicum]SEI57781.1 Uncharacterized membrane protein, DUF4010 family [Allopseudospirillum japonicum]